MFIECKLQEDPSAAKEQNVADLAVTWATAQTLGNPCDSICNNARECEWLVEVPTDSNGNLSCSLPMRFREPFIALD